jgi:hypothetical protein
MMFINIKMKVKFHYFVVKWRKYAALPLLVVHVLTGIFFNQTIIYGLICALWLTVPCGIPYVNRHWFLWYPRQIFFAFFSIIAIFHNTVYK